MYLAPMPKLPLVDEHKKTVAVVCVEDGMIPRRGDHILVTSKDKTTTTYEVIHYIFASKDFAGEKGSQQRGDIGTFVRVRRVGS
jgi:hypothetical protein